MRSSPFMHDCFSKFYNRITPPFHDVMRGSSTLPKVAGVAYVCITSSLATKHYYSLLKDLSSVLQGIAEPLTEKICKELLEKAARLQFAAGGLFVTAFFITTVFPQNFFPEGVARKSAYFFRTCNKGVVYLAFAVTYLALGRLEGAVSLRCFSAFRFSLLAFKELAPLRYKQISQKIPLDMCQKFLLTVESLLLYYVTEAKIHLASIPMIFFDKIFLLDAKKNPSPWLAHQFINALKEKNFSWKDLEQANNFLHSRAMSIGEFFLEDLFVGYPSVFRILQEHGPINLFDQLSKDTGWMKELSPQQQLEVVLFFGQDSLVFKVCQNLGVEKVNEAFFLLDKEYSKGSTEFVRNSIELFKEQSSISAEQFINTLKEESFSWKSLKAGNNWLLLKPGILGEEKAREFYKTLFADYSSVLGILQEHGPTNLLAQLSKDTGWMKELSPEQQLEVALFFGQDSLAHQVCWNLGPKVVKEQLPLLEEKYSKGSTDFLRKYQIAKDNIDGFLEEPTKEGFLELYSYNYWFSLTLIYDKDANKSVMASLAPDKLEGFLREMMVDFPGVISLLEECKGSNSLLDGSEFVKKLGENSDWFNELSYEKRMELAVILGASQLQKTLLRGIKPLEFSRAVQSLEKTYTNLRDRLFRLDKGLLGSLLGEIFDSNAALKKVVQGITIESMGRVFNANQEQLSHLSPKEELEFACFFYEVFPKPGESFIRMSIEKFRHGVHGLKEKYAASFFAPYYPLMEKNISKQKRALQNKPLLSHESDLVRFVINPTKESFIELMKSQGATLGTKLPLFNAEPGKEFSLLELMIAHKEESFLRALFTDFPTVLHVLEENQFGASSFQALDGANIFSDETLTASKQLELATLFGDDQAANTLHENLGQEDFIKEIPEIQKKYEVIVCERLYNPAFLSFIREPKAKEFLFFLHHYPLFSLQMMTGDKEGNSKTVLDWVELCFKNDLSKKEEFFRGIFAEFPEIGVLVNERGVNKALIQLQNRQTAEQLLENLSCQDRLLISSDFWRYHLV